MGVFNKKGIAEFGPLEYFCQWGRVIFWGILKKTGTYEPSSMEDQSVDRIADFDEFPYCSLCGSDKVAEEFTVADGSRIVRCEECGLLFTSPRINEKTWMNYLKEPSERSITFTENRVKYGVALPVNTRFAMPTWFSTMFKEKTRVLEHMEMYLKSPITRLHDVGCGIGFQLIAAEDRGITASGNDLNGYACEVMRNRLGLTVYNAEIHETPIPDSALDALIMDDYIEHTYHPRRDLEKAYTLLRPGGVLYLHTFHIGCRQFDDNKLNWNYLFWNHTHHFSVNTMKQMLSSIGYEICELMASYESEEMTVVAKKPE